VKAAVRHRYGSPDAVELVDVAQPVPTEDRILVQVRAASVNRADLDALAPRPQFARLFIGVRRPRVPRLGIDVAGVVTAVGPDVTRFKIGDHVYADLFGSREGTFAEFVCEREKRFEAVPAGVSLEDASTLPHSAVLAVQGLRLRNGRTPGAGDRVLIAGASGNVGPFAVQIAKALGCEVTGVCRTEKVDFVRSLGADHVIDYTTTDYTRTGPYDWIVDVDAHQGILGWRRALRPNGVYVAMGGPGSWIFQALFVGPIASLATGKRMGLLLGWKPFKPEDVAELERLIAAGKIKPVIDRRFPLSQVVEALRYVDDGHPKGKVVITVAEMSS